MIAMFRQKIHSLLLRLCWILPAHWHLPLQCWVLRVVTRHEREAFNLKKIGPCRGMAVDAGANFGLYSWYLSKIYPRVVAFEPNPEAATPLLAARLSNVEVIHEGLSSQAGSAKLWIPMSKGVMMAGWGSLDRENLPGADKAIELSIQLCTLDSYQFQGVGFIKIDVEGHELEVLRGGEQTIKQCRPKLVVEVQECHLDEVRRLLHLWHYHEVTLASLGGGQGSAQNLIFLPD
jgi:FkbM family methyltransferase